MGLRGSGLRPWLRRHSACRELAEQGKKVILIEKQPEDTYAAVGNEFASLNAKILQERGVPHIDPVEFYQNFMKITSNMPNPTLVMKFAQNSEENSQLVPRSFDRGGLRPP